jgi:hypothetical protein
MRSKTEPDGEMHEAVTLNRRRVLSGLRRNSHHRTAMTSGLAADVIRALPIVQSPAQD